MNVELDTVNYEDGSECDTEYCPGDQILQDFEDMLWAAASVILTNPHALVYTLI